MNDLSREDRQLLEAFGFAKKTIQKWARAEVQAMLSQLKGTVPAEILEEKTASAPVNMPSLKRDSESSYDGDPEVPMSQKQSNILVKNGIPYEVYKHWNANTAARVIKALAMNAEQNFTNKYTKEFAPEPNCDKRTFYQAWVWARNKNPELHEQHRTKNTRFQQKNLDNYEWKPSTESTLEEYFQNN